MRKYLILGAVLLLSSVTATVAQDVRYNFLRKVKIFQNTRRTSGLT